jgi:hypothetical protein
MRLDDFPLAQDDPMMSASRDDGSGGNNLPRILSVLELLTEEELVQLNHVIVQRLRLMQQIRAHGRMVNLRVGQSVSFTNSTGQRIRGVIARHNRKSVTVVTPTGEQWRVAPGLIQAE